MNHLIKILLLALLFLIPRESIAQESEEYSKYSFSIRGKWLYLPGWENVSWRSYSCGGEIFFGKHHAIGIDWDGYQQHWRNEEESSDVLIAMEITKRSSIYTDYKYVQRLNEQFSLYGQVYSRLFGRRKEWIEKAKNYEFDNLDKAHFLKTTINGNFTDVGLGVGVKWYFNGGNSGLDFCINAYQRFGKYKEERYIKEVGMVSYIQQESPKISCYARLVFFYHFFRYRRG